MPRALYPGQARCTEINSVGIRCAHAATHGDKCGYHYPWRRRCEALKEDGERCDKIPMVGEPVCNAHTGWKNLVAHDSVGRPPGPKPEEVEEETEELESSAFLIDITDSREFAKAVLESRDFRQYIVNGLKHRDLPVGVVIRLMDYADGWGKPVERVEHTGKDGQPIEAVTEVRCVVIHADAPRDVIVETEDPVSALKPH